MAYEIEFSSQCQRDLSLIHDYLIESYQSFGESPKEAFDHASLRLFEIIEKAEDLTLFPLRGTMRDDIRPGIRFVALNQTIYWFSADEARGKVTIYAIFMGKQNHIHHMLARLLDAGESAD